ncbi:MAG: hypothetical protein GF334_00905 [Candidatus Altiarchaeales archaeon]|nr:hypothetical protein [Candidatus Altiarchaeales archaeon]
MADTNNILRSGFYVDEYTRAVHEASNGRLNWSQSKAVVEQLQIEQGTNTLESIVSVIEDNPNGTSDELMQNLLGEGQVTIEREGLSSEPAQSTSTNNVGPLQVISNDPGTSTMRKLTLEGTALGSPIAVRSPGARRTPEELPFFIQLLDSDLKVSGMAVDDVIITGIRFTPNPETFAVNSSKMTNRYQTMTRWVEEYWGDEMDTITFTGSSYSMFGYDPNSTLAEDNTGLTMAHRENTKSYQLMRALVTFFTYNGCIYQDDSTYEGKTDGDTESTVVDSFLEDSSNQYFVGNHPRTGMVRERLYVNLFYDYGSYLGYFETFDLIEDATSPFRYTYNIIFRSERTKYVQGSSAILRF